MELSKCKHKYAARMSVLKVNITMYLLRQQIETALNV